MANKSVFATIKGKLLPATNTHNFAGGPAYEYGAKHKLAQLAMTGTFSDTYYASAEMQVNALLEVAQKVDPEFLAKASIYARHNGFMKDTPAFLLAVLSGMDTGLFKRAFPNVIDNGKMLRNFVQIMRSGVTGRKSLGSAPKRMVQNWIETANIDAIIKAQIGNDPSLGDVIKMVHPAPSTKEREALYAWIMGKPTDFTRLPVEVQEFMRFQKTGKGKLPNVPFQMLTNLPLGNKEWSEIAKQGQWHMVRMNLNSFLRHGVFESQKMVDLIAQKLRDETAIRKARVFPYQLLTALRSVNAEMPREIIEALEDALEIATQNVPAFNGKVAVCVDVSGSMGSPVTGHRYGSTGVTRCVDVAALIASCILRKTPDAQVLPFDGDVRNIRLNARDTIATNAASLSFMMGGATNCAAPMEKLARARKVPDLVIYVSDNQSWIDAGYGNQGTQTMQHWNVLKRKNPKAKMVCIDIQPYGTTQSQEREDILNIGGFSDQIFEVINRFDKGTLSADHWVGEIERINI